MNVFLNSVEEHLLKARFFRTFRPPGTHETQPVDRVNALHVENQQRFACPQRLYLGVNVKARPPLRWNRRESVLAIHPALEDKMRVISLERFDTCIPLKGSKRSVEQHLGCGGELLRLNAG